MTFRFRDCLLAVIDRTEWCPLPPLTGLDVEGDELPPPLSPSMNAGVEGLHASGHVVAGDVPTAEGGRSEVCALSETLAQITRHTTGEGGGAAPATPMVRRHEFSGSADPWWGRTGP